MPKRVKRSVHMNILKRLIRVFDIIIVPYMFQSNFKGFKRFYIIYFHRNLSIFIVEVI